MVITINGHNEESYWKLIECLKEFNRNVYELEKEKEYWGDKALHKELV